MEVRTCVKVQMCRKTSLRFIGQPGKRNRNKLLEEKSAKRAVKKSDGKQETVGWTAPVHLSSFAVIGQAQGCR